MDKRVLIQLQGDRRVTGTLRGFDIYLNIVLDDTSDESVPALKENIGTTVCLPPIVSSYLKKLTMPLDYSWPERGHNGSP